MPRHTTLPMLVVLAVLALSAVGVPSFGSVADPGSPGMAPPFEDVDPSGVHAQAIERLRATGTITGVSPRRFDPDGPLTRGQLATMLQTMTGTSQATATAPFTDIAGSVHRGAIAAMAAAGVAHGTSPTTYSPERPVTRAQVVAMLVRIDGHDAHDPRDAMVTHPDGRQSDGRDAWRRWHQIRGHTFERELVWASMLGYLTGTSHGLLQPDDVVSRAQTASLLSRYLNAQLDQPTVTTNPNREPSRHGSDLSTRDVGPTLSDSDLRPSGPLTTQRHGEVIEGLSITVRDRGRFGIRVAHDDVVIRNNHIEHGSGADGVRIDRGTHGAVVENNLFDAVEMAPTAEGHLSDGQGGFLNNNVGSRTVDAFGPVSARHNRILVTRGGIRLRTSGSEAIGNWFDAVFTRADSPGGKATHGTSISLPGGPTDIEVSGNRVVAGSSGGIVLYAESGPQIRIAVLDNLIVGRGEGMGIYGGRTHLTTGHYADNRAVQIEGNRFTGTFGFPNVAGNGTNAGVDLERPGNSFLNNRWTGSATDLPGRCGITRNACEDH